MLHVDLIAPIAKLLDRHAKERGTGCLLGFVALDHLTRNSLAIRGDRANLAKAGAREGERNRDLSAERRRLDRGLLRRPARRRRDRSDQF